MTPALIIRENFRKMTKRSIKGKEINRSLTGQLTYSAVVDLMQNQTAILITNEQPRAEIETSGAALAGNIRKKKTVNNEKETYCDRFGKSPGERVVTGIIFIIAVLLLSLPGWMYHHR